MFTCEVSIKPTYETKSGSAVLRVGRKPKIKVPIVQMLDDNGKVGVDVSASGGAAAAATRTETATHACNLVESGMRDVFTVHLDWRNKVVAVSVSPGEARY